MHKVFRVLAQQMGMQQVRGILPESIDVFINSAIYSKVKSLIQQSAVIANSQQGDVAGHSIESINALRGLYRSDIISFTNILNQPENVIGYDTDDNEIQSVHGLYPTSPNGKLKFILTTQNVMQYISFRVKYLHDNALENNYIGCRFIGSDTIDDTLKDYCNGADIDNPIVVLMSDDTNTYLELYTNTPNIKVGKLDVRYIKNPKTVKWDVDEKNRVNCDLPDYCHYEIVQMAVQMYFQSIGATTPRNDNNNNNNNN